MTIEERMTLKTLLGKAMSELKKGSDLAAKYGDSSIAVAETGQLSLSQCCHVNGVAFEIKIEELLDGSFSEQSWDCH